MQLLLNYSHPPKPQGKVAFYADLALFGLSASKNVHIITNLTNP